MCSTGIQPTPTRWAFFALEQRMSTTPTASAHVCTPHAPPCNWVGNIIRGTRCQDADAKYWNDPIHADFIEYVDAHGRSMHNAQRHSLSYPYTPELWSLTVRQVANGRQWETRLKAVTDDFGWLVEVPAR